MVILGPEGKRKILIEEEDSASDTIKEERNGCVAKGQRGDLMGGGPSMKLKFLISV